MLVEKTAAAFREKKERKVDIEGRSLDSFTQRG